MKKNVPSCHDSSDEPREHGGSLRKPELESDVNRSEVAQAQVEALLSSLFISAADTQLRREDLKKAHEITAFLSELSVVARDTPLVDAAAGKSYLGLLAVELLQFNRLHVIERSEKRLADCRHAAARLTSRAALHLHCGEQQQPELWPTEPSAIVALHACGAASDAVVDAAIRGNARWVFLVPCCYGAGITFWEKAQQRADELGLPRAAELRKPFLQSLIVAHRVLRLEAAGFQVTVVPFVAPTVTPHNLLIRGRKIGEPVAMAHAEARLKLLNGN